MLDASEVSDIGRNRHKDIRRILIELPKKMRGSKISDGQLEVDFFDEKEGFKSGHRKEICTCFALSLAPDLRPQSLSFRWKAF
jgi:hypothetical protein